MEDVDPRLPSDPVVRFRLRSMFALTTGLAILAGIAGSFYRRQSPVAQSSLLVFWTLTLVFGCIGLWLNWRLAWSRPDGAGTARFMLWRPRSKKSLLQWPAGKVLWLALWFVAVAAHSVDMAQFARFGSAAIGNALPLGIQAGLGTSLCFFFLTRQPALLCDDGVVLKGRVATWKRIRIAQWSVDREDVLEFHLCGVQHFRRVSAPILVEVPRALRDDVENLLRENTRFIEPAPTFREDASANAEAQT